MVSINSPEDWQQAQIARVRRNAESHAELVAVYLDDLLRRLHEAGRPIKPGGFPAGFLLELAATCQLEVWEQVGVHQFLPVGTPTAAEARADIWRRVRENVHQFVDTTHPPLSNLVCQLWRDHCHWLEPDLVEAPFIIGALSEDEALDCLAQLLWKHRSE